MFQPLIFRGEHPRSFKTSVAEAHPGLCDIYPSEASESLEGSNACCGGGGLPSACRPEKCRYPTLTSMFEGQPSTIRPLFNQNEGHLGSRYTMTPFE